MRTVIISLLGLILLAACNSSNWHIGNVPFRPNVTQGNVIDQASLDALRPGMSKSQVLFLMGSPLIVDPFHLQRWDYVYSIRLAWKPSVERRVSLYFQGDRLVRVDGDLDPETGIALQEAREKDSEFNAELREVRQRQEF
jgi:outer membrane protein assembly factor BamE